MTPTTLYPDDETDDNTRCRYTPQPLTTLPRASVLVPHLITLAALVALITFGGGVAAMALSTRRTDPSNSSRLYDIAIGLGAGTLAGTFIALAIRHPMGPHVADAVWAMLTLLLGTVVVGGLTQLAERFSERHTNRFWLPQWTIILGWLTAAVAVPLGVGLALGAAITPVTTTQADYDGYATLLMAMSLVIVAAGAIHVLLTRSRRSARA